GTTAFDRQRIDHCLLKRQGDVTASLLAIITGLAAALPGSEGGSLEAAEAEIQPWAISHRTWKDETPRSTALGQRRDFRATGVAQPHQFGSLVEGFTGGIVHRLTQQLVTANAVYAHQLRMPTRNQQGDERERWRLFFEHGRQQMAFHMMHADGRYAPGKSHRLRTGRSHQ